MVALIRGKNWGLSVDGFPAVAGAVQQLPHTSELLQYILLLFQNHSSWNISPVIQTFYKRPDFLLITWIKSVLQVEDATTPASFTYIATALGLVGSRQSHKI